MENRLLINCKYKVDFIDVSQITFVKADEGYSHIHLNDQSVYVQTKTLSEVHELIGDFGFIKVCQSYLVNIEYIQSLDKKTREVILKCGYRIPYTLNLKQLIGMVEGYFNLNKA